MAKILRKVSVSKETALRGEFTSESLLPSDKHTCSCVGEIAAIKKGAKLKYMTCPEAEGKTRYLVTCKDCSAEIAYVYAVDEELTDWCDVHYTCATKEESYKVKEHYTEVKDGKNVEKTRLVDAIRYFWHGAFATHISPVDGHLGFECTCGNDTRDFRANTTLPAKVAEQMAKDNLKGRAFNKWNSKFKVKEVK